MKATETAIPPRVRPLRQRFLARFRKPILAEIIPTISGDGAVGAGDPPRAARLKPWRVKRKSSTGTFNSSSRYSTTVRSLGRLPE